MRQNINKQFFFPLEFVAWDLIGWPLCRDWQRTPRGLDMMASMSWLGKRQNVTSWGGAYLNQPTQSAFSFIRKIFYPDLTILGCSDPQIRQIACRLPLSALIPAGSPQIHQITLDILDQLEQPGAPNWPISPCSVVWYLNQSNPSCYHTCTPVTLVAPFKNRSFYLFYPILLICHATGHHLAYRFPKHSFLLRF